jgi:hypothetical protein
MRALDAEHDSTSALKYRHAISSVDVDARAAQYGAVLRHARRHDRLVAVRLDAHLAGLQGAVAEDGDYECDGENRQMPAATRVEQQAA